MNNLWEKSGGRWGLFQKVGPLMGLGVIVIILSVISEDFLSVTNIFNVLRQVSITPYWPSG